MKLNSIYLSLLGILFLGLIGCQSKSGIGVVQNGIGVVQNGIGSVPPDDMGTVAFDAVNDSIQQASEEGGLPTALTPSRSSGRLIDRFHNPVTVPGLIQGSVTIEVDPTSDKLKFTFDDYQFREGYPVFKSGVLTTDIDSLAETIQGTIESEQLKIGEQDLAMKIEYDLKRETDAYAGSMKGRVSVNREAVTFDKAYDTPIFLFLETNQERYEPGQDFQFNMVVTSNAPLDRLRVSLDGPTGNKIEDFEGELKETAFDEVRPGLWQAFREIALSTEVILGNYSVTDLSVVNDAGLRSNEWPGLSFEFVPEGSGVKTQSLNPELNLPERRSFGQVSEDDKDEEDEEREELLTLPEVKLFSPIYKSQDGQNAFRYSPEDLQSILLHGQNTLAWDDVRVSINGGLWSLANQDQLLMQSEVHAKGQFLTTLSCHVTPQEFSDDDLEMIEARAACESLPLPTDEIKYYINDRSLELRDIRLVEIVHGAVEFVPDEGGMKEIKPGNPNFESYKTLIQVPDPLVLR